MLLTSNTPQGDLWLTERKLVPNAHQDMRGWGKYWLDILEKQEEITHVWIGLVNKDDSVRWVMGVTPDLMPAQFSSERCTHVIGQGIEFIFSDHLELISGGLFPLIYDDRVLGLVGLLSRKTDYFKTDNINWLRILTKVMADSLVQGKLENRTMDVEYSISKNLLSNLDVQDALPQVLKILAETLEADAVTALRYIPLTRRFELLVTHGLERAEVAKLKFHFDAGLVGKWSGERPLWIEDLRDRLSHLRPINRLEEEGFRGYLALPLIAHHDLVGALEIAWRSPQHTKTWDDDHLERVAEQVAQAMERADILGEVQQNNAELTARYIAMIEGLSRALELRDLETEGHTRRVSQLTMQLVEHIQIPPEQWDSIRQGALLHDIGKLGIPDAILLKPGSLTPREKKVMQQHVVYGYNILAPITSARHTLDITLYHHEHWDGTGYPYGLKGEQIPQMARVFAVVDVFDALKSDRPYRTAWSHSKVIEYLKEQSGRCFDPQVVKLFLEIVTESGN